MPRLKAFQNHALKTDFYELTMAAGYFQSGVTDHAVFELSCHTMPANRSYLVACGLTQIVDYILNLRFSPEDIRYLQSLPVFKHVSKSFFSYLKSFRFSGDVWAMPEGQIYFAHEPVIQIVAPIIEAQILETYLLSVMNIESLVATKASRIVRAASADGLQRGVVDFGSRRAHGPEAGILAARASYIGGCLGTSNVHVGRLYGIPLFGTVAHSWVEAFDTEEESFKNYYKIFPENTILLVDTYDTLKAVKRITQMEFSRHIRGVRIDSGNLSLLSRRTRDILDRAGLSKVKIIASGNLNEYKIQRLVAAGAPIDFFGVGTDMVTSRDYPALDLTYKLVQTGLRKKDIKFKAKTSPRKQTVPGRKQIFRRYTDEGRIESDLIGLFSEKTPPGTKALLKPIIRKGRLLKPLPPMAEVRGDTQKNLNTLTPDFFRLKGLCPFTAGYTRRIAQLIK